MTQTDCTVQWRSICIGAAWRTWKAAWANIAETLANAVQMQGGQVLYRHQVTAIRKGEVSSSRARRLRPYLIETKRGTFEADVVLANLTPWALVKLMGDEAPSALRQRVKNLKPISGAFMAYLGVDVEAIQPPGGSEPPGGWIDHHQVIVDPSKPLPILGVEPFPFLRELLILGFVGLSLKTTTGEAREGNKFNYTAILEVAALFIGIFISQNFSMSICPCLEKD